MQKIKYKDGQNVTLTVIQPANMLLAYLAEGPASGRKIYGRETFDNPKIQDRISISPSLRTGKEELMMIAANCVSDGQIEFLIEIDNTDAYRVSEEIPQYGCKSWTVGFEKI